MAGSLAALSQKDFGDLDGPLGEVFLQSIRDRWSATLGDASVEEIAAFMKQHESHLMVGVASLIKGKMFEHLVMIAKNNDGDQWEAHLYEDETKPGSVIRGQDTAHLGQYLSDIDLLELCY